MADDERSRPDSVRWYVWVTLAGFVLGSLVGLIDDRAGRDAPIVGLIFVFAVTSGILALLLRGVWRGSRLAWILSTLLQIVGVFFLITRFFAPPSPETVDVVVDMFVGVITSVVPMVWLFHKDTRAWCRVVF